MAKRWAFGTERISRRTLFKGAAGLAAAGVAGKWLADRYWTPDEPERAAAAPAGAAPAARPADYIDVREFKKSVTVEELNRTAEEYFARLKNWDFHLAKPLGQVEDTPELLNNFAHVLQGLQLLPGMSVVDFGAGSCWASRWLTQLGMEAIAVDVSRTALKIGEELYKRLPIIGDKPPPRFLPYDGRRIGLPDESVDRIMCLDTYHHLLNQDEVLRELHRILKPGGIAGFSEPGPRHSSTPQSQAEMRNFRVLEDDVHIDRIWDFAKQVGFARIRLAVFNVPTFLMDLPEFEDYLKGGAKATQRLAEATRAQMEDRRIFFLQKAGTPPLPDSRSRAGLAGKLEVALASPAVAEGAPILGQAVVTNTGRAVWLPRSAKTGWVQLGCHLLDASGKMLTAGYSRHALTPGEGRPIKPGETVTIEVRVPPLRKGSYILEFDLVSESVAWFAVVGSRPLRLAVKVG